MCALGDVDHRFFSLLEWRPFNSERRQRVRTCQVIEISSSIDWHGKCLVQSSASTETFPPQVRRGAVSILSTLVAFQTAPYGTTRCRL
jgi:hypothetical protein